jgi:hypothetical protein
MHDQRILNMKKVRQPVVYLRQPMYTVHVLVVEAQQFDGFVPTVMQIHRKLRGFIFVRLKFLGTIFHISKPNIYGSESKQILFKRLLIK